MSAITGVMPAVRGEVRQSATWSIVFSVLMIISGVKANRQRSSSVRPRRCARRMRFSSTRYATASCCWSDHLVLDCLVEDRVDESHHRLHMRAAHEVDR
jgi:hypothetical protein